VSVGPQGSSGDRSRPDENTETRSPSMFGNSCHSSTVKGAAAAATDVDGVGNGPAGV
jgi:hypothetical protein